MKKVMLFAMIVAFITFVVGTMATRNYDDELGATRIELLGSGIAALGAILSLACLIVAVVYFIAKSKPTPNIGWYKVCMLFIYPVSLTINFLLLIDMVLDLHYFFNMVFFAYEEVWYDFNTIIDSPVFWITFGLVEIIMVAIMMFKQDGPKMHKV